MFYYYFVFINYLTLKSNNFVILFIYGKIKLICLLRASVAQRKYVVSCGCKNWDWENIYSTKKKANVYHKLEGKGLGTMASASPIRAKFQDLVSWEVIGNI